MFDSYPKLVDIFRFAVVGLVGLAVVVILLSDMVLLDSLGLVIVLTGCVVCVLLLTFCSVELLLVDTEVGMVDLSVVDMLIEGVIELPKKILSGSCGVVGVVVVGSTDVDLTVVVFSFIFGTTGLTFCFFGKGDIEDITFDII